jgi:hypothetical protein
MSADFESAYDDLKPAIALNLRFKAVEELALHFDNLSTAQASHVNVIALRTPLIIVLFPLHMHQIQLIHQAVAFQQVNGAIHSNAIDPRIDLPCLPQDLRRIQVLFGRFHDAKNGPALVSKTQTA